MKKNADVKKHPQCRRKPIVWRARDGCWYASCCTAEAGQETGPEGTREEVVALWNHVVWSHATAKRFGALLKRKRGRQR